MNWLNVVFGVVGIVSLVFSIYTYYKTESKKVIEAAKVAMQKERMRNTQHSLIGILHTIDAVVQIPKKGNVTIAQLQDLARVARAQVFILANELKAERKRLDTWQFGKLVESNPEDKNGETVIREDEEDDETLPGN